MQEQHARNTTKQDVALTHRHHPKIWPPPRKSSSLSSRKTNFVVVQFQFHISLTLPERKMLNRPRALIPHIYLYTSTFLQESFKLTFVHFPQVHRARLRRPHRPPEADRPDPHLRHAGQLLPGRLRDDPAQIRLPLHHHLLPALR